MTKQETILNAIRTQAVLPLFYHDSFQLSFEIIQTLYHAGIRVIEYTNRGSKALENFTQLKSKAVSEMPDLHLGIGTVRHAETATQFLEVGADFLVSPVFDAGVCDVAYLNKTLWMPGCMTVTEIHDAEKSGCELIKLFPGNVLGPGFVTAIRELFPHIQFMPTGGVEPEEANLKSWFDAGVMAVGIGSKLISKKILENKDLVSLEWNTKELITRIKRLQS